MILKSRKTSKFLPEVVDKLFELMFETLHLSAGDPHKLTDEWIQFELAMRSLVAYISSVDTQKIGVDIAPQLTVRFLDLEQSAAKLLQVHIFSNWQRNDATKHLASIKSQINQFIDELNAEKITQA